MKKLPIFLIWYLAGSTLMAQDIVITVPDAIVPRVVNALCQAGGYQANIPDPNNQGQVIPNPQSKAQFAVQQIKSIIQSITVGVESRNSRDAQQNQSKVDIQIP